jgi:hypothetical protein
MKIWQRQRQVIQKKPHSSRGFDILQGSRGSVVVAGSCISADSFPKWPGTRLWGLSTLIRSHNFSSPFSSTPSATPKLLSHSCYRQTIGFEANPEAASTSFGLYLKVLPLFGVNIRFFSGLVREVFNIYFDRKISRPHYLFDEWLLKANTLVF